LRANLLYRMANVIYIIKLIDAEFSVKIHASLLIKKWQNIFHMFHVIFAKNKSITLCNICLKKRKKLIQRKILNIKRNYYFKQFTM